MLLALACLLLPLEAGATRAEEWVESTGTAAVKDGNYAEAWRLASHLALEQAVETVASRLVSGLSERPGYSSERNLVVGVDTGLVVKYRVIDSHSEEGVCRVTVNALVAADQVAVVLARLGYLDPPGDEDALVRWRRLEIEGLSSYGDLVRLQTSLRMVMSDIRDIRQSLIDGDEAVLEILTGISTQRMAAELMTRDLGGLSVRVTEVDPDAVSVRIGE